MDINRNRRLDRAYAERLLAGDTSGGGALAGVLAAASAPAAPADVPGEDAAVAAFHAARAGNPPVVAAPRSRTVAMPRWLTVRFAVLLLAFGGVGASGVAVAASTGVLPALPHHHNSSAGRARPHPAASASVSSPLGSGANAPAAPPSRPPASAPPSLTPPAAASPSFRGLCHAYAAALKTGRPDPGSEARFARLVAAAGGRSKVMAFCQPLLAGPSRSAKPPPTGKPSTPPTGKRTTHPTGKPSTHPTGRRSTP